VGSVARGRSSDQAGRLEHVLLRWQDPRGGVPNLASGQRTATSAGCWPCVLGPANGLSADRLARRVRLYAGDRGSVAVRSAHRLSLERDEPIEAVTCAAEIEGTEITGVFTVRASTAAEAGEKASDATAGPGRQPGGRSATLPKTSPGFRPSTIQRRSTIRRHRGLSPVFLRERDRMRRLETGRGRRWAGGCSRSANVSGLLEGTGPALQTCPC